MAHIFVLARLSRNIAFLGEHKLNLDLKYMKIFTQPSVVQIVLIPAFNSCVDVALLNSLVYALPVSTLNVNDSQYNRALK